MQISKAYRYELKPTKSQRSLLAKHAGVARFAYNWGLARRVTLYKESGTSINAIAQHRELNALKESTFPWMYEVSKCAPQEALRDLDKAFKNFFRGLRERRQIGFPKFKKRGVHDSFRLTGAIKVLEKAVKLPRLGKVKLKERQQLRGRILSATVTREADRWFVSIAVVEELADPAPIQGAIIGIDVGITTFATLSDGTKIEAPKPLQKYLKKLRQRSKKHSRKVKGSSNRKKSAVALARLHRRIRNSRSDFLHKLSTLLAKTKQEIVIEDLCVKGMVQNEKLAKQISDAGWGEFRRMLTYKTVWYGSTLTMAPRFAPTSKACSACGSVVQALPLSVRLWTCDDCGTEHDRDINAAINISRFARTA